MEILVVLVEEFDQLLHIPQQSLDFALARNALSYHDEFVTAEATDKITAGLHLAQQISKAIDHHITHFVTLGIVHDF